MSDGPDVEALIHAALWDYSQEHGICGDDMPFAEFCAARLREAGLLVDGGHFEYAHTVDDVIVPHRWAPAERRTKPVSTHRRTVGPWVPVVDTETRSETNGD